MSITASHHDTNVIFRHEVMLRTMSTFHSSITGTTIAEAAFPWGVAALGSRTPVYLLAEVAKRAPEAVF